MSIDTQVCFRGDALVGSWAFITHHHCERICSCPTGWFSDFSKYFTVHYFFKLYNLSRISVEIAGILQSTNRNAPKKKGVGKSPRREKKCTGKNQNKTQKPQKKTQKKAYSGNCEKRKKNAKKRK